MFYRVFPEIILILLFYLGCIPIGYTQSREKDEARKIQIDSIFKAAEASGLNTSDVLQYDYFFTDDAEKQLEALSQRLVKDSFETIGIIRVSPKTWRLQVRKNEKHSRQSLFEFEEKLRRLAYNFIVQDYSGFSISHTRVNGLIVPDDEFISFIHSLDDSTLYSVALDMIQRKKYSRALIAFDESINRQYKEDTSHFQLGNALVATNEFVKGIEHWEKARNLNPQYLEAFLNLGNIFFENSHFNRALYNFKKADELRLNNDDILYHISKCLLQLERYNEAFRYAKRAVKLNPKNVFAKSLLKILKQPAIKKLRKKYPDK
jgi:tetratricopeptide (TPR) repeat protein